MPASIFFTFLFSFLLSLALIQAHSKHTELITRFYSMFIRFSSEFLLFDKVKHQNHLISAISNLQLVSFKKR